MKTSYFIVPASGYFDGCAVVLSSHRTLAAAQRALRRLGGAWEIRVGAKVRGELWFAHSARSYLLAPSAAEVRS